MLLPSPNTRSRDTSAPSGSLEGLPGLCPGWQRPGFATSWGRDTSEGCPGCSGVTSRKATCQSQSWLAAAITSCAPRGFWQPDPGSSPQPRCGPPQPICGPPQPSMLACLWTTPVGDGAGLPPHPLPPALQRSWAPQRPLAQALFLVLSSLQI